jgi:hypothetical protein
MDARSRDPSNFGGETLDVILFPLQHFLRHEHREICIFNAHLLNLRIEPFFVVGPRKSHHSMRMYEAQYLG